MYYYAIILIFICSRLSSQEIESLVSKLTDEDFYVREIATQNLSTLESSFSKELYHRALKTEDVEVKWRLRKAAKNIWHNKILPQDERWQRLHGTIKIVSGELVNWSWNKDKEPLSEVSGLSVSWVGIGPCADKIIENDVIVEINGIPIKDSDSDPMFSWGRFKAGTTYSITVKRFKDNLNINGSAKEGEAEHEILTYQVEAVLETDEEELNMQMIETLEKNAWLEYVQIIKNK